MLRIDLLCNSPSPFPEDIIFAVLTPEVEMGPENPDPSTTLSCSVANNGRFDWQWRTVSSTSPLPSTGGRYRVNEGLADVQSSSLEILRLRKGDEDVYVCEVRPKGWDILVGSGSARLQLNCKDGSLCDYIINIINDD